MLKQTIQDAINEQVKNELYSAYVYLSMSAYCETIIMPGFAHWLRVQSQEEVEHAMKLFDYVVERGGRVVLQAIDQPPVEFGTPLDVAEQALDHEQKMTQMIHQLYELAGQENDYATEVMLQWFISEQVEEEHNARDLVEQIKTVGEQPIALLTLDRHLGKREE